MPRSPTFRPGNTPCLFVHSPGWDLAPTRRTCRPCACACCPCQNCDAAAAPPPATAMETTCMSGREAPPTEHRGAPPNTTPAFRSKSPCAPGTALPARVCPLQMGAYCKEIKAAGDSPGRPQTPHHRCGPPARSHARAHRPASIIRRMTVGGRRQGAQAGNICAHTPSPARPGAHKGHLLPPGLKSHAQCPQILAPAAIQLGLLPYVKQARCGRALGPLELDPKTAFHR